MNLILSLLFDFDIVENILRPEWIKLYDQLIVDNTYIEGLKRNYNKYNDFLTYIQKKALEATAPAKNDQSILVLCKTLNTICRFITNYQI